MLSQPRHLRRELHQFRGLALPQRQAPKAGSAIAVNRICLVPRAQHSLLAWGNAPGKWYVPKTQR